MTGDENEQDDVAQAVRLRTLVRRLFILDYFRELDKAVPFDRFESGRGMPTGEMMREIAQIVGLLVVKDIKDEPATNAT